MRLPGFILTAICALLAAPDARADANVSVGGPGCQYATIQAAINAANNDNGTTNIKIARNATYTAQQINITSKNVRLIGGFANCGQINPDTTRTAISGAGGSANTVITVLGTTTLVAFQHLEITGGDEVTTNNGFGGGVAIGGGPHQSVSFDDTYIHDNQAGYGGGVWIRNEYSSATNDVNVLFGDNVRIDSNYGAYGGGGLWCSNAEVMFVGSNSYIARNHTSATASGGPVNGSGGGVRAENCQIWFGATSTAGTLSQNTAGGNGGGLSISGEKAYARFYSRKTNRPSAVLLNSADGVGGGIDVGSSAQVIGFDLIVSDNIARAGGGGIAVFDNDDSPDAKVTLQGTLNGAPDQDDAAGIAVNCNAALLCNRISNNIAATSGGSDRPGAAARVYSEGSSIEGAPVGSAALFLSGTRLNGNIGESLLRVFKPSSGNSDIYVDGALIDHNQVSGVLLHNPDLGGAFGIGGSLIVNATTIADNVIGGNEVFRTTDLFQLKRSIVWQPDNRILYDINGSPDADKVDYLLGSDLLGIPPSTHNFSADPQFTDAMGGDYRLTLASPGVDFAPPGGATADHQPRVVDLGGVANLYGPQDLGAYERQFACAADTVFCNGFE